MSDVENTIPMPTKPRAVKKEPGEKKAKVRKEGTVPRPRLPKFPDEHLITVLKPDSKARGAAERFQRYHTGQTVKDYVEKITADFQRTSGLTQADLRWDMDHGFIHVGPEVVPVPAPQIPESPTAA